jgi:hypothetical protein
MAYGRNYTFKPSNYTAHQRPAPIGSATSDREVPRILPILLRESEHHSMFPTDEEAGQDLKQIRFLQEHLYKF